MFGFFLKAGWQACCLLARSSVALISYSEWKLKALKEDNPKMKVTVVSFLFE
jgi:hypothetical protein